MRVQPWIERRRRQQLQGFLMRVHAGRLGDNHKGGSYQK